MRLSFIAPCLLLFGLGACCTKEDCVLEFYAPAFYGFTADEVDTIRIVAEDMEGNNRPDTTYTRAVFYGGSDSGASVENPVPFNSRNSYTYYLPAINRSYRIDGYEFSYRACNSCFPPGLESKDHPMLQAYRLNGERRIGQYMQVLK